MKHTGLSDSDFKEIENLIESKDSVVGIDAKKTHIIIIHMLEEIQQQLDRLENKIQQLEP